MRTASTCIEAPQVLLSWIIGSRSYSFISLFSTLVRTSSSSPTTACSSMLSVYPSCGGKSVTKRTRSPSRPYYRMILLTSLPPFAIPRPCDNAFPILLFDNRIQKATSIPVLALNKVQSMRHDFHDRVHDPDSLRRRRRHMVALHNLHIHHRILHEGHHDPFHVHDEQPFLASWFA